LTLAARDGDFEAVFRLLQEGADPNVRDGMGETPLFEAVMSSNVDMIAALMTHSADPFIRSLNGSVAVDFAASDGDKVLLHLLTGSDVDLDGEARALKRLGERMLGPALQHLKKQRAQKLKLSETLDSQSSLLPETVEEASRSVPPALLQGAEQGISKEEDDSIFTPRDVHAGLREDAADKTPHNDKTPYPSPSERTPYTDSTIFDTPQGTSPQKEESGTSRSPPQPSALLQGDVEQTEEDSEDRPPLMMAVQHRDMAEVMRLLESGIDVNAADAVGETALFEAAASGNADMVASLILAKADPSKISLSGLTASELAADPTTKVLLLLFQGAEVEPETELDVMEILSFDVRLAAKEHLHRSRSGNKGAENRSAMSLNLSPSRSQAGLDMDTSTQQSVSSTAPAIPAPSSDLLDHPEEDRPPLILAAQAGNFEQVRQLMMTRADVCV
jgi:ankyrin repeat protein